MKTSIIKFLSSIFPNQFTQLAYRNLTHPQVKKLRERELKTLNKASQEDIAFEGFTIRTYHWPNPGKSILLIHGWEGQAGNFSDIIEHLITAGYNVYAFDGPSHGFSSKGTTSMFEFIELVSYFIQKLELNYLISHSFGGVATTYALSQLAEHSIEKYILLTTPDRFSERIDAVADQVGIAHKVKLKLIKLLEDKHNIDVQTLNVSDFVKDIQGVDSLIIHGKDDRVIPIQQSQRVHKNWPGSSFLEVEDTGHFRILRSDPVFDRVLDFLA